MAKSKRVTILLRNKKTGSTYVMTRHQSKDKMKGIKKYDPVTKQHELFDEEKSKN
jgi:ribosomal protein L33